MNLETCYCRNQRCKFLGKINQESVLRPYGSRRGEERFVCGACSCVVEAREGTAYASIRTDLETYELGTKMLAEGMSMAPQRATFRATARILHVDKDTVCDWVSRLGQHCADVARYYFRNLHLTECQFAPGRRGLDELWTFVYKKEDELTPIEYLHGVYGDAKPPFEGMPPSERGWWVWIA